MLSIFFRSVKNLPFNLLILSLIEHKYSITAAFFDESRWRRAAATTLSSGDGVSNTIHLSSVLKSNKFNSICSQIECRIIGVRCNLDSDKAKQSNGDYLDTDSDNLWCWYLGSWLSKAVLTIHRKFNIIWLINDPRNITRIYFISSKSVKEFETRCRSHCHVVSKHVLFILMVSLILRLFTVEHLFIEGLRQVAGCDGSFKLFEDGIF